MLRAYIMLVASTLAIGCGAGSEVPTASRPASSPSEADNKAVVGELAQGLALALNDQDIRTELLQMMRRSPYTSHKIDLRSVFSEASSPLTTSVADALGTSAEGVIKMARGLPAVDVYVPSRDHRRTWGGEGPVLVAATLSTRNPTLPAFTSDGQQRLLDPRSGPPRETLVLLQRAEPKGLRINPQPDVPGRVIEEAHDGNISGRVVYTDSNGSRVTREFADMADLATTPFELPNQLECPPWDDSCEGGGGGGGGGVPPESVGRTYIDRIETNGVCDNDLCNMGDTNEFVFETRWTFGSLVELGEAHIEGIQAVDVKAGNWTLHPTRKAVSGSNDLWMVGAFEDDGELNIDGDDELCPSEHFIPFVQPAKTYGMAKHPNTCYAGSPDWLVHISIRFQ